mgnify:CR=1 FL=1
MSPDTFFFVRLIVDKDVYSYGPYLDLESATIILMDVMPAIAKIKAKKNWYSYECLLVESILHEQTEWQEVNTHLIQNKCYKKRN